jgi:hypothetical protein
MDGAKVIWILFGDIRGAETRRPMLESIYRKHQAAAEAKGYTIGFSQPQGTSTKAFIHLIKDPVTYMFIWHSHGTGDGGIWTADEPLNPALVGRAGPNVKKVALWACKAGHNRIWHTTLGLPVFSLKEINFLAPDFFIYAGAKDGWQCKSNVDLDFATGAKPPSFARWIDELP